MLIFTKILKAPRDGEIIWSSWKATLFIYFYIKFIFIDIFYFTASMLIFTEILKASRDEEII